MNDLIVNGVLLVLLIALGIFVIRLNRKIDRLRAALLEVGPTLEAYEAAIAKHKESLSNFSVQLDETTRAGGKQPEAAEEEDLSRIFYKAFGKEVK
ncbi:hypothetical protein [Neptunicoccus cionae]|uniref:hypothetical protein n=1 Tax=Neptunicoccus cionae TaxID=2035344 RepID=UPI000C771172|nr:hypothetical protein [Amylibacter cionae]PLS21156.1 hypothetical protein C0U40_13495 [Amylibacter cionae]